MNHTAISKHHPKRSDDRVIIHFDYDCFYASVFEVENPALKSVPLAVQQKQIIVTCNYEARRRGLRKLQSITEAKVVCPDVIIVLGEDLTRFRNASKMLYNFIRGYSWNDRVERLGFDEVWMDVTDIIEHNIQLLNRHDLAHSFFQTARLDPLQGFTFDATRSAGHVFDAVKHTPTDSDFDFNLRQRLILASHLALHVRHQLEEQKGYTSTVGIATNKLISKLVGNVNKPKGQTTLLPPYAANPIETGSSNLTSFLDAHDIGSIPYIGFKIAQIIRHRVLGRPAAYTPFADMATAGPTLEAVLVAHVRLLPGLSPKMLDELLAGPNMQHGIGMKVYNLIHGIDDTPVAVARDFPRQISIEDSYIRLNNLEQVTAELQSLCTRLIMRMRVDLVDSGTKPMWLARPTTIKLTTRPRASLNLDRTRPRTLSRISRSTHAPAFMFTLSESEQVVATRLVTECIAPLFKKLHPETSLWNLSLLNVAITGIEERSGFGKNIESAFRRQVEARREWGCEVLPSTKIAKDVSNPAEVHDGWFGDANVVASTKRESLDGMPKPMYRLSTPYSELTTVSEDEFWEDEGEEEEEEEEEDLQMHYLCGACGVRVPLFAMEAHERFHGSER